jgi:hypothetical protein
MHWRNYRTSSQSTRMNCLVSIALFFLFSSTRSTLDLISMIRSDICVYISSIFSLIVSEVPMINYSKSSRLSLSSQFPAVTLLISGFFKETSCPDSLVSLIAAVAPSNAFLLSKECRRDCNSGSDRRPPGSSLLWLWWDLEWSNEDIISASNLFRSSLTICFRSEESLSISFLTFPSRLSFQWTWMKLLNV